MTSYKNKMYMEWHFRKSCSMAILVVVCVPFMFNVAILIVFMVGEGGRRRRCLLVYSALRGQSRVSLEFSNIFGLVCCVISLIFRVSSLYLFIIVWGSWEGFLFYAICCVYVRVCR